MAFSKEFRIKFHWNSYNSNLVYNLLFKDCTNVKGNVLLCGISNINLYKKFIEEHKNEISTLYIVDDEPCKWYIKSLKKYFKNIYFININTFVKNDNMPKFDYIIQNPPYKGSTHLDFFNKGLDLLSDTGKMVIIEPSTWFIELRQNIANKKSSQMKKYISIKERIKGHVSKVIIENCNNEFNVGLYVPCSITYIDKAKTFDEIEFINYGVKKYVDSLDDCNLIGNIKIIKSIFEKIKNYDVVTNHRYLPNKSELIEGNYYIRYAGIIGCGGCIMSDSHNGFNYNSDALYSLERKNICWQYTSSLYSNKFNYISEKIHKGILRGSVIGTTTDKDAECITGTKQELENWKYYVFNNSLPLFINICLTIDQHNNSLPYVPWLVDKQYTDEEIYKLFNFSNEEIKLIETTIKKYERYSPWFKRYMCGPSLVSDEEVQKFINELENA